MGDFMRKHARQLARLKAAQKAFGDAERIARRRANRERIHRLAWNHIEARRRLQARALGKRLHETHDLAAV